MNWVYESAVNQRAALRRGDISAQELLELTIEHTESLIPFINPIALRLYDSARKSALRADRLLAAGAGGPLCGVPITIKDSQWLAGVRCANGSWSLQDHVPKSTSQAVLALLESDAVIFAKTTCPEFSLNGITDSAMYGRTSNPWDLLSTCGGSSGGAGAAVAAGMGALSLGGDGGGSIRIPAAFCGITGFKPTHGVVKRSPGFKTWASLVAYGPMTRTVADAELMFNALVGDTAPAFEVEQHKLESHPIVVSSDLGFAPLDNDVRQCFEQSISILSNSGMNLHTDNPELSSSAQVWSTLASYDMWTCKGSSYSADDFAVLGNTAKEFMLFGSQFTTDDFTEAQRQSEIIDNAYNAMFDRHNSLILITPTVGCQAFAHGRTHPPSIGDTSIDYPWLDWAGMLYDANLTGMPAITIPMGLGAKGLPLGLQISGRPGSDKLVLNVAKKIEELLKFQPRHYHAADYHISTHYSQAALPLSTEFQGLS